MITRIAKDEYHIETIGREIDMILSWDDLVARLRPTGVWTEDHLNDLRGLMVGEQTRRPVGVYA